MPPLRNKVHVEIAKQQLIRHSLLARGAVGPHACYAAEASWLVTAPARASLRLCRARTPPTESGKYPVSAVLAAAGCHTRPGKMLRSRYGISPRQTSGLTDRYQQR